MVATVPFHMSWIHEVDPTGILQRRHFRTRLWLPSGTGNPAIHLLFLSLEEKKHDGAGFQDAAHLLQGFAEHLADILAHAHGEHGFQKLFQAAVLLVLPET